MTRYNTVCSDVCQNIEYVYYYRTDIGEHQYGISWYNVRVFVVGSFNAPNFLQNYNIILFPSGFSYDEETHPPPLGFPSETEMPAALIPLQMQT